MSSVHYPYPSSGGGGGGGSLSDGDYGDVLVSGSGTVLSIDTGAVSTSKLGGDITTAGKALLDDATAAAQRTTLGLGTAATQASSAFAAASHTHTTSDIVGYAGAIAGTATITIPSDAYEYEGTFSAVGITSSKTIVLSLAPVTDDDENDPELLDLITLTGEPGTDQITASFSFSERTSGAIKVNYIGV